MYVVAALRDLANGGDDLFVCGFLEDVPLAPAEKPRGRSSGILHREHEHFLTQ